MAELFFEDLIPGRWFDLGMLTVDGDEMVAFARRFDPQWYHVDEELARQSHHGGLIASGFYTVSLFMRAYVDHVLSRAAADASPGLEELRWLAPVRAGDRLAVRLDVMGSKPSTARPGLGTVTLSGTMLRLDAEGRPECEVLRTRFRGWFTLREQDESDDVTEPDSAVDGDEPLPDDPNPVAITTGPDPMAGAAPAAGPDAVPAPGGHPATVAASRTGPMPVLATDARPSGPPVSGPPAPIGAPVSAPPHPGGAPGPVSAPPHPGGAPGPVSAPPHPGGAPGPVSAPPLPGGSATQVGASVSAPPLPDGPTGVSGRMVASASSVDAPTAVLPGPVLSAPPAPTGPAGQYGLDAPTAVIPAARDPHDHPDPSPPAPSA
ncbi:MaoC/PaaZ C-terminal domain-containing protein [Micromonospora echinospora]|uniref:MaoC/PaaZ C-terminal domain-containing protein n=1 Tax=Micromonospora echinospora TaxID=1877 RepID=UPI003409824D